MEKLEKNLIELRKNVDILKYNKLKKLNENDMFYSWAFDYDNVLYEDVVNDGFYTKQYIKDILNVYIEVLEKCQK